MATLLNRFIAKATFAMAVLAFIKGVIKVIPVFIACIYVIYGLDRWFEVSKFFIQMIWVIFFVFGVFLFISSFYPIKIFSIKEKSRNLALRQKSNKLFRSDDLFIAHQLSLPSGGLDPSILSLGFIESVEKKLKNVQPIWCFPIPNWKIPVTAFFLAILIISPFILFPSRFVMEKRILFPFIYQDLDGVLHVEPGDSSVLWGADATVKVQMLTDSIYQPKVFIRFSGKWQMISPVEESGHGDIYLIKNIVKPVSYRVLWKKNWGRKYTLIPVEPLRLAQFNIRIDPPSYLKKDATTQTSPEISGLLGSSVTMEIQSNASIKQALIQFSNGEEKLAETVGNEKAVFKFFIEKETTYSLIIENFLGEKRRIDGFYPIHLVNDQPPSINLLSPDQDLVIGENEKIPLTYDAKDDFGIEKIFLNWERNGQPLVQIRIDDLLNAVDNKFDTAVWDLAKHQFRYGDIIRYQLEVFDGNTVSGPGRATTPWRTIEIASFEREHAAIDLALENWRERTVDLLAKVNTMKSEIDKGEPPSDKLANDFNETSDKSIDLEKILKRITSRMEEDPLADYSVWLEHNAMGKTMEDINQRAMPSIRSAIQTHNQKALSQELGELASELERMMALSDDLGKAQRARDVLNATEELENIANQMGDLFESSELDFAALSEINRLVSEAQKNLQKLTESLQRMPEELPEDFINQEALKDLDLKETGDIISQIAEAIKNGNAKAALQLAKSFLDATRKMAESVSEAHEEFLKSRSASELAENLSEQTRNLEKVIQDQSVLLSQTKNIEGRRLDAEFKSQADFLSQLALQQKKVVDEAKSLLEKNILPSHMIDIWREQINPMEDIRLEFEKKQLDKTFSLLGGIVIQLKMISEDLNRSTSSVSVILSVNGIEKEEVRILEELNKRRNKKNEFSKEDINEFGKLSEKQAEVLGITRKIQNELQQLARKTATLDSSLMKSLSSAGSEMGKAGESLRQNDSRNAKNFQENALAELLNSQTTLEKAQRNLSEMATEQNSGPGDRMGSAGSPKVMYRSGRGTGGGTKMEKVRLPRAEDYRPPKEFREDLLEALKEKYPKIYEDIIHKYYKRLAQ